MYFKIFKDMKFFDVSFYIVKNKCKYLSFRILIIFFYIIYLYRIVFCFREILNILVV